MWLEAFLAVVEHGSHNEAAKRTGCSQSTISRYLFELQDWLRRPLFVSNYLGELTDDGIAFRETAQKVVALLEESRGPNRRKVSIKDIDMSKLRKPKADAT
ncbi:LysR family transcriptional regulator [Novosphingobium colocasiae]|uniref:LysR family transcriptional regulator n=1 Tax=Novosphingobium colocasiae TaxID=1256513 RepID=UPI0035B033BE